MKIIDKKQNILKTWRKVKLGDIVEIRRGASPRPIHEFITVKGMPWLKIADITSTQSRYVHVTKEFIKNDGVSKSVTVKHGDLILSNSATPGIPRFMRITACIHDGWLLLKPNENQIDKNFLYYRLIMDQPKLISSVTGSIFNNLNTDTLKRHEVQLPSIIEQKQIAGILSAFDDKIELNNKINQDLEQMAQAIFKEWFINFRFPGSEKVKFVDSELGKIPKAWEVKNVEEIINFEKGVEPGSVHYTETKKQGFVPFYRVRDLDKQNGVDVYIPKEVTKGKICSENDILLSLDATVGRVKFGCNGAFSSGIRKVYSKDDFIKNSFIYFWLKTPYVQNTILEHASGTTIFHAGSSIKFLKILFNREIINKFQKISESIFNKILEINKENQKLISLRDLLLPKLMNGEIKVKV